MITGLMILLSINIPASFYPINVMNENGYFHRLDEEVSRTISLCTGMQSSTMAGLLASQFLGTTHAVPPACSVVAMAIMGLSLASFWGNGSRIRDLPSRLFPRFGTTVKA